MGWTRKITFAALFPAHAGVILVAAFILRYSETIPRTRGGDPYKAGSAPIGSCYSPHTRG